MAELNDLLVKGSTRLIGKATGLITSADTLDGHHAADFSLTSHTHSSYSSTSHKHVAGDITGGTLDIARIPTGTTSTTVARGDHSHSSYAANGHTHFYITTSGDTRSINSDVAGYRNKLVFVGLKSRSTIGFPGTDTYGYLVGLCGWSDASGGNAHEMVFSNSGIYHRTEISAGGWNDWETMLSSSNAGTVCLPLTGGTMTGKITMSHNVAIDFKDSDNSLVTGLTLNGGYFYLGNINKNTMFEASNIWVQTSNLAPWSSKAGQINLGLSSSPWKAVYAQDGFFQTSDARLKNFASDVEVDLDKLAQLPKKYFTWKTDKDAKLEIGTSAQAVRELYPELVSGDENGQLSVDYAKLSIIALKAIDIQNEKIKQLESDIAAIKEKLGL